MEHSNIIRIRIRGQYGCFTDPAFKVERLSYKVPTPSACRGILDAIYNKPINKNGFIWEIKKICMLKTPGSISITQNELTDSPAIGKIPKHMQRLTTYLVDIDFVIEAQIITQSDLNNLQKHYAIFMKRAKRGGYHHRPCLGMADCFADYKLLDGPVNSEIHGKEDLGFMFYDWDYSQVPKGRMFYHPIMIDGIITVPSPTSKEVLKV